MPPHHPQELPSGQRRVLLRAAHLARRGLYGQQGESSVQPHIPAQNPLLHLLPAAPPAHMGQHELPGLHRVQHPLDPSYRREIFPREPYIIARMSYDNHVIFARAFYDAQIPDVVDRHPLEDRVNLHPSHAVLRKAPQNRPVILILGMDAAEGYQPRLRGMPVRLYGSLIDVLLLPGPGHNGQQHGVIHPRLPHGSPKRPGCAVQIVPGPGAGRQSADSPPGQLLGKCMCVEIDDHINPPFSPLPSSAGPAFFPYRDIMAPQASAYSVYSAYSIYTISSSTVSKPFSTAMSAGVSPSLLARL